jgi:hypothetical protein
MPFILPRKSFWADKTLLIDPRRSIFYRWGILIGHRETLFRTDFYTKITGATFKAVDLPFFAIFDDNNGVGWAPFAAYSAKNAPLNIYFHAPPANLGKNPLSLRIHEGCRPFDQVLSHRFCHGERFHLIIALPFCAADTRVQGQNNIRDICHLRTFQYFDHPGNIGERGDSHPEPLEKF